MDRRNDRSKVRRGEENRIEVRNEQRRGDEDMIGGIPEFLLEDIVMGLFPD